MESFKCTSYEEWLATWCRYNDATNDPYKPDKFQELPKPEKVQNRLEGFGYDIEKLIPMYCRRKSILVEEIDTLVRETLVKEGYRIEKSEIRIVDGEIMVAVTPFGLEQIKTRFVL